MPFHSVSGNDLLSRGSAGQVFAINSNIVLKCPSLFDNPALPHEKEMEESITKIENEKKMYTILARHPHPNIVYGIVCAPEGLFMQRMDTTLQTRLELRPASSDTQERWIRQLASAIAWIESLGYVHGDLKPANILLDQMENIKVCDFDATVKIGEELLVASEPFTKMNEDYETPPAGPLSEQFSLGSCIYNIRFRHKPYHDLDAHHRVRRMIEGDFPSTSSDGRFGEIISGCWRGKYNSIHAVEADILARSSPNHDLKGERRSRVDYLESWWLYAQCKEYLAREHLFAASGLRSAPLSFQYWGQRIFRIILGIWQSGRHCWGRITSEELHLVV